MKDEKPLDFLRPGRGPVSQDTVVHTRIMQRVGKTSSRRQLRPLIVAMASFIGGLASVAALLGTSSTALSAWGGVLFVMLVITCIAWLID